MCEEAFGPVLCVMATENDEEAVAAANSTCYGLSDTWPDRVNDCYRHPPRRTSAIVPNYMGDAYDRFTQRTSVSEATRVPLAS